MPSALVVRIQIRAAGRARTLQVIAISYGSQRIQCERGFPDRAENRWRNKGKVLSLHANWQTVLGMLRRVSPCREGPATGRLTLRHGRTSTLSMASWPGCGSLDGPDQGSGCGDCRQGHHRPRRGFLSDVPGPFGAGGLSSRRVPTPRRLRVTFGDPSSRPN